jgi:hypothetical protein
MPPSVVTAARAATRAWTIGFALVLLSGLAIAWVTGAARFTGWRRATTFALSLAAPLALATALTAAAYS